MKFTVCIPNYNYEKYLPLTLDSVLASSYEDYEIVVADNASTDKSIEIVKTKQQIRNNIKWQINSTNVGFAHNLDRSGQMATGDVMIMLSSDDIMTSDALSSYHRVIAERPNAIVSSSCDVISSASEKIGYIGPNKTFWRKADVDPELSKIFNCEVYRVKCGELLRRCLVRMGNPFNFCTVAYSRSWYNQVGGYGGGRLINPDKWFHWKLMSIADEAIYIDKPLFQYRWHNQNQNAQQKKSGHIKYLIDEYRSTIEIDGLMLNKAGMKKDEFIKSFVKNDIYRHGIGEFTKARWLKSLRIFFFGLSTYPAEMAFTYLFPLYMVVLITTPFGAYLTAKFINRKKDAFRS